MSFRMITVSALGVIASLYVLGSSAVAQDNAKQSFAQKAALSNRFEIEAAKLALQKGKDGSAKEYAQDMIDDHSKSLSELEEAAKAERVILPLELDAENMKKLKGLSEAPASDFDQAYLSTQVVAHEDAVELFMSYSKDGPNGMLKNYAMQTVGTLRAHSIRIHGLTNK